MAGQVWAVAADGGHMYSDQLSSVLRTALQPLARFRQFTDIQEGKGQSAGDKLYWNVYSDLAVPGGSIAENVTIPETKFTIRQESLTVTEYANSVPFTQKLDDLSKHSVTNVINKVLKHDARKTLDSAAHVEFDKTPLTVGPGGVAGVSLTDVVLEVGGATITNDAPLTTDHVKKISDIMKERNITPFDGEHFCAIARPAAYRPFKDELEDIYKYVDQGFGLIFNGEIGRYEGIRFTEQTNVASEGWASGKSDAVYFFGADTVAEGIVIPEEIRGAIPTDSLNGVPYLA